MSFDEEGRKRLIAWRKKNKAITKLMESFRSSDNPTDDFLLEKLLNRDKYLITFTTLPHVEVEDAITRT